MTFILSALPGLGMELSVDLLWKALAVVGGAILGAFVAGLFLQGTTRLTTGQKVPRWAVQAMRVLGGLTTGLVMGLVLFRGGTGSGGLGGGEGLGLGGTGATGTTVPMVHKDEATGKTTTRVEPPPPQKAQPLRVEVVRPTAGSERWYRLAGEGGPRLLTLAEFKTLVGKERQHKPPLEEVIVVLYNDSPDRSTGPVQDLTDWLESQKLKVELYLPREPAPRSPNP